MEGFVSRVMLPDPLEATRLWKKLDSGFGGQEGKDAKKLAQYLLDLCQEARDRMKAFPSLHPQYTLHDDAHLLRVTELMAMVMPRETLDGLNPVEIALLILAAHLHDQGMVLEREELEGIRSGSDPDFKVFRQNWEANHPNLREVRRRLRDDFLSAEQRERLLASERELQAALLTDYVRRTHGRRSATFVRERYGDDNRMKAGGASLAPLVAKLCRSHAEPASLLTQENGYHHDELVGTYSVNMPYLGLVLRLADILDFDRDRTPDSLYRTISFTSGVSLVEWAKHRSVEGWRIDRSVIQYRVSCEEPAYERAVREFMDWIDDELGAAQSLVRRFPRETPEHYTLDLPTQVDRDRIGPNEGAYVHPYDLEFSLSRDEIVGLFMTDRLYKSHSLCVRELLQNSLDALRHRRAMFKRDRGIEWEQGKVLFEHTRDEEGREVLRCTDNGVGMNKEIIARFLTDVGRSYYRSPEFDQERASFAAAGADFDPIARFGIGFLSCFMLGDQITIRTRRDLGRSGEDAPIVAEVNGLGGILTIREGPEGQPVGTTVEVVLRDPPPFHTPDMDEVKLVETVYGFALACEVPVQARCVILGIEGEETIPPGPYVKATEMEEVGIERHRVFEQEFRDVDPRLGGRVRVAFLVDADGKPTTANEEAYWVSGTPNFPRHGIQLRDGDESAQYRLEFASTYDLKGQTSLDGILVSGALRRTERRQKRGGPLLDYTENVTEMGRAYFALDARGEIKPPLTPARRPAAGPNNTLHPEWLRIVELANLAHGRLWEQVAEELSEPEDGDVFWQLLALYDADLRATVSWMRAEKMWSSVSVPVLYPDGRREWLKISSLGYVRPEESGDHWQPTHLVTPDGGRIAAPESVARWWRRDAHVIADERDPERRGPNEEWDERPLHSAVLSMSTLVLEGGTVRAELRAPTEPDRAPWEHAFQFEVGDPGPGMTYVLPYSGELRGALCANSFVSSANREHPLVREALRSQYAAEKSDIGRFAEDAVYAFSQGLQLEGMIEEWPIDRDRMRYLGNLYSLAAREGLPPELRPPYRLWSPESGTVEIDEKRLLRWAGAEWTR